jgi:hypothetical protein
VWFFRPVPGGADSLTTHSAAGGGGVPQREGRIMEHGWLSTKYRANVMRTNIRGEWCLTEHTAANICLDELNKIYGAINILRNGPRILRAMNTVKKEMETKYEIRSI